MQLIFHLVSIDAIHIIFLFLKIQLTLHRDELILMGNAERLLFKKHNVTRQRAIEDCCKEVKSNDGILHLQHQHCLRKYCLRFSERIFTMCCCDFFAFLSYVLFSPLLGSFVLRRKAFEWYLC